MSVYNPITTVASPDLRMTIGLPTKPSFAAFSARALLWVGVQLSVTFAICGAMYARRDELLAYLSQNPVVPWIPVGLMFASLMFVFCATSRPARLGGFAVFTLSMSFVVGVSVMQYSPRTVMLAAAGTWGIVWAAAAYSARLAARGEDLEGYAPALGGILTTVVLLGLLNLFLKCSWLNVALAAVSVVLFTAYLIYDLTQLYDGADADDPMLEDGLIVAIGVYLDIINIFVNLLALCDKVDGGS
jgi:FtsH-binding integral membrane protein